MRRTFACLLLAAGCADDTEPVAPAVPCAEQSIAELMLFEAPAGDAIEADEDHGRYYETLIDATGGGLEATASYVYVRFTPSGVEQVAIGDEAALRSTAWHLALRRYVLRVNSGVAGPGSVRVARTAPMTDFEALDEAPASLAFREEAYFTESCDLVPDGSGLGAPGTALSSFWSYPGCVAMTGNVYVLELEDGARLKLEVLAYYSAENQATCNETGMVPMPSGAGHILLRWALLD